MNNSQGLSNLVGTSYDKMNCWDLVKAFYKIYFSLDLKHIYEGPVPEDKEETHQLIYSNKGEFVETKEPIFGDVIIISIRGLETHIAVYLGSGRMIHSSKGLGVVIDRIDRWNKIIVGYYRHRMIA